MKLSLFNYNLPQSLIAQKRQKTSRLLILDKKTGRVKLDQFANITSYLHRGDLLVFNNTKVFKSRLWGKLETGGQVEIFILKKIGRSFEALGRPGKKLTVGRKIIFTSNVHGVVTKNNGKIIQIRFNITGKKFDELLESHGHIPVPPYIKQEPKTLNEYQTIYAKHTGSVAAPTSGFHFTPELIKKLKNKGIRTAELTLHVGLGTFLPITAEKIENHKMHAEEINVPASLVRAIQETKRRGGRVIAVGTTTTRALEGVTLKFGRLKAYRGPINLFIKPGFKFKVIDGLITNFHLPASTLLILVSAFAGRARIQKAYALAIKKKFKFFSFGDAMLIH